MEAKDKKLKSDVLTGVSSSTGAVAGVVIGSMITEDVYAEPVPFSESEVLSEPVTELESNPVSRPEPDPIPEPEPVPTPEPNTVPDVQVLAYETVPNDMGGQSDLAVVSVDGQPILFADVDQDGVADIAAADVNGNGQLDPNEFVDISQEGIAMQPFRDEAGGQSTELLAQNEDTDYINNADVDDFMA